MKLWFLYVLIATVISMFIQTGLDNVGVLNLKNVWADFFSWLVIFFVVYVLIELAGRAVIGSRSN
ncbi:MULTISPECIES: hypothetical protein [Bacillus]|uniref:hypothetical protein n=1 Tax=Bacillus TaxID=1386 RepID=UPI0007A6031B|nr:MULTISPECIES: hypothetical protein [Bacillus]AXS61543.1 hypothetical protein CK238_13040 [Bacillus velezensis]AYV16402.1 hypothetical protein EEB07_02660 [Bacillus velezensis]KAF6547800.1 hypothetical protein G9F51_08440 [Bacillus sp. EKM207B]KAF6548873.1 hypothetical protein G9F50_07115 [Bacillus sp. EKM206B]MCM8508140.1 hypothetical protein [Bacillus amyloliquefaciens]